MDYIYDPQNKVITKSASIAETNAAIFVAMGDKISSNRCAVKYGNGRRGIIVWYGASLGEYTEKTFKDGPEEFNNEFERIRMNSRRPRIF